LALRAMNGEWGSMSSSTERQVSRTPPGDRRSRGRC
jgi:hypothetical protein